MSLLSDVKIFSWKRVLGSVPLAGLLFIVACYFTIGTGLVDAHTSRWNLRELEGALLFPAAFIPDRFESIRSGWFVPDELRIVLPLQILYAYALLTFVAIGQGPSVSDKIKRILKVLPPSLVALMLCSVLWVNVSALYRMWKFHGTFTFAHK